MAKGNHTIRCGFTAADVKIPAADAFNASVADMLGPRPKSLQYGCKDPRSFRNVICDQRAWFLVTGGAMQQLCDSYLSRYRAVMKERQRLARMVGADGTFGWTWSIAGFLFNLPEFDDQMIKSPTYFGEQSEKRKWYHQKIDDLLVAFEPDTWKVLKKDDTPCRSHSTRKKGNGWGVLLRPANKGPGRAMDEALNLLSIPRPSDFFGEVLSTKNEFIVAGDQCGCGPGLRMLIPSFEVISEKDKIYLLTVPVSHGKEHQAAVAYGNVRRLRYSEVWKLYEQYKDPKGEDEQ